MDNSSSTTTTTTTQLVLRQDAKSCLAQIQNSQNTESVSVEFDGCTSDNDFISVFQALSHLPRVQRLRVIGLNHNNVNPSLPIQALSVVIHDPFGKLCHLHLENINLSGTVGDYMGLVGSLRLCSLQSIQMDQCEFADQHISLDPFIRALATISTLERLSLSRTKIAPEGNGDGCWKCQCLQPLLPQLRALSLNDMPEMQHEQISSLADALESPWCALKELTIQNQALKRQSIHRIAKMLETNHSLEELTIGMRCKEEVVVLARSIQKRPSGLKRLSLPGDWGQQQEDFYSDTRHVLLEMVQASPSMVLLDLGEATCDLSIELNNYTTMNRSYQSSVSPAKVISSCGLNLPIIGIEACTKEMPKEGCHGMANILCCYY